MIARLRQRRVWKRAWEIHATAHQLFALYEHQERIIRSSGFAGFFSVMHASETIVYIGDVLRKLTVRRFRRGYWAGRNRRGWMTVGRHLGEVRRGHEIQAPAIERAEAWNIDFDKRYAKIRS